MQSVADQANQQMVDRLIAEGALWSPPLIAAFRSTPRHLFLDRTFQYQRKHNRWREVLTREPGLEELRIVYSDRALITHLGRPEPSKPLVPISSSSQPSLMAQMLEDLRLAPGLRVLEIGSGTGYNAALLAAVVRPGRVVSVDVDREVLSEAWAHLRPFSERAVELRHADGREGWPEGAPYDRIMVTAATPDLEPAWLGQLAEQGLLLAPLALAPGLAFVVSGTVHEGLFSGRLTRAAYFMGLRAEDECGPCDDESPPPAEDMKTIRAPWAGWFERKRSRGSWFGFIQALAFFGFLQGLRVHYQSLPTGESVYGIDDGKCLCWLGMGKWHLSAACDRALGWNLWRSFLDLGGPRPTEYILEASPDPRLVPASAEGCHHQGPRCRQRWLLFEPRERPVWY